jgi:hypothetical protein
MTQHTPPTHRKSLNSEQLKVLDALYHFRFGTTDLLASMMSKHTSRRFMNERLRVLCEQAYIGRRYDSSYKLQAKFATYYLLPNGIKVLKQQPDKYQPKMLRNIRKDVSASDRFVEHSLNVFTAFARLKLVYGTSFAFDTRSNLSRTEFDYFPEMLPDGYATYKTKSGIPKHFMIECFDATKPQKILRQRIAQIIDHEYTDGWKDDEQYPEILIVCDTEELKQKAQKWVNKIVEDEAADDMKFYVTSLPKLAEKVKAIS